MMLTSTSLPASDPSSLVPVPQTSEGILARQNLVLQRARESAPGGVVFVGDSITQAWDGTDLWTERFVPMGAVNLGVSGDRTEHVLWRLEQAPLTRLAPKAVVLLIGTNNLGHGTSTAAETLAGIRAVVDKMKKQVSSARIVLCAIFPVGKHINAMRGEVLQINQALARAYANDSSVTLVDLGSSFVDADGNISPSLMPDGLHLAPAGYTIWADGIKAPLEAAVGR